MEVVGQSLSQEPDKLMLDPVEGEVYAVRVKGVTYGIAGADGEAEQARVSAESARVSADQLRESRQADSDARQVANDNAQVANDDAQTANDTAQTKNNADQALNNAAAQGLTVVMLGAGEYDEDTSEPTGTGEVGKLYYSPIPGATGDNVYAEWMWIEGRWERVGASAARPDPITTDQMDEVASEGVPAPTGTQTLNLTGLSYLWSKFKEAFAPKAHTHVASDVTDLTSTVMDLVYQVGDYWITESTQTPAQRGMPGVWSAQEDIFLVGAGGLYKVGTTGGERSHTLTVAEMPRHNHMNYVGYPGSGSNKVQYFIQSSDVAYWAEEYSQSMGGGAAHENMPPYRAVYIWKRTA